MSDVRTCIVAEDESILRHSLVAEHFQKGRVFLGGDAVHLFTPTGGLGYNTAVEDAVNLAWKQWPGMAMNPGFDEGLRAAVPAGKKVVLLCRSGVRSVAAAKRATELGLEAYNILEGFEGDPDAQAHRGNKGGWRMRGLPWRQG